MYSTLDLYKIEQEILHNIGITIPNENIVAKPNLGMWSYDTKTKSIIVPEMALNEAEDEIDILFPLAYETGYLFVDFIVNSGIDIFKLKQRSFEKALRSFFDNKSIVVNEHQFNEFKFFITNNLQCDEDFVSLLKFDLSFDVTIEDIKMYATLQQLDIPPYHIYTKNTVHIFATEFATKHIYGRYKKEKRADKDFQSLATRVKANITNIVGIEKPKSELDYEQQMVMHKYADDDEINNINSLLYKKVVYKISDFPNAYQTAVQIHNKTKSLLYQLYKEFETEEQVQVKGQDKNKVYDIIKNHKNGHKMNFIDNFAITSEEKFRCKINRYDNQKDQIKGACIAANDEVVKEVVIDLMKNINYVFHVSRT